MKFRWYTIGLIFILFLTAGFPVSRHSIVSSLGLSILEGPILSGSSIINPESLLAPSLTLSKTVGTDPNSCATTDSITIDPGSALTSCYQVTNTGDGNLVIHTLIDDKIGELLSKFSYSLSPGASAFITSTITVDVPVINIATWYAHTSAGVQVQDSALAKVNVNTAAITLKKTVGFDPNTCASTDSISVTPGTQVTYCYKVTNSGEVAIASHNLVDDQLGTILHDFPFNLTIGASSFLTQTVEINASVVNTATWTARTSLLYETMDSANAEVFVFRKIFIPFVKKSGTP